MEVKKAEAEFAMIEDHKPSSDWSKSIYVRCGEGEGSEVFISWTGKQKALIKQFQNERFILLCILWDTESLCVCGVFLSNTALYIPLYRYQKP